MDSFAGKVAVVTGGAAGVGLGMAQAFGEVGMRVVVADIDEPELATAVTTLTELGVDVLGVVTDVADACAVDRLRDATYEHFGTAHVLCNNAGTGASSPLPEPIDVAVWDRILAIDFFSILYGLNAFLPRMREQGDGHVVNTSSRQGLIASPGQGPYPAAKAASVALSEMLREELAAIGSPIGVTVLTPGGVRTKPILTALAEHRADPQANPTMLEFLESRVAAAVEPLELGRLVLRAVRENVLYVNTHRETLEWLQDRVDRMVADADALGTLR
jgi:NAD(P)-dependent dehydrogenase (short-subunit alcohol dehydrogenase family)